MRMGDTAGGETVVPQRCPIHRGDSCGHTQNVHNRAQALMDFLRSFVPSDAVANALTSQVRVAFMTSVIAFLLHPIATIRGLLWKLNIRRAMCRSYTLVDYITHWSATYTITTRHSRDLVDDLVYGWLHTLGTNCIHMHAAIPLDAHLLPVVEDEDDRTFIVEQFARSVRAIDSHAFARTCLPVPLYLQLLDAFTGSLKDSIRITPLVVFTDLSNTLFPLQVYCRPDGTFMATATRRAWRRFMKAHPGARSHCGDW